MASALDNVRRGFSRTWFGTWLTENTSKLARVSRFHSVKEQWQCKHFWRLVHTLDTAGKRYCSQLLKLVTDSLQRDYATGYCHRRRREQEMAQHGVLRKRHRAVNKYFTATLYNLTDAFANGAQESQGGDPASLADMVRTQEQVCQGFAGAQLRLECVDGQIAAKIGSGRLPGDTVAGGWFLLRIHPKIDAILHDKEQR